MELEIGKIKLDENIQPRVEINTQTIAEYAEDLANGAEFPPVIVFFDGADYWLADGYHRIGAFISAQRKTIAVDVHQGTRRNAMLYAVGANTSHGLRRTNEDKRRAVHAMLADVEWRCWPNTEIARQCAVGEHIVRELRKQYQESSPKAKFNRTNDNIEWAWWSWNPVTGCKHGCPYCYARDIAMRFQGTFEPQFHAERLTAPENTAAPAPSSDPIARIGSTNVFVCSMADLFGDWVPQKWIDDVLDVVRAAAQWNFIFLTKNPARMVGIAWPVNAWVGTTVDCQARIKPAVDAFRQIKAEVKFVSCEPMNEALDFGDALPLFDWVIIGGRSVSSGASEFRPPWQWVYRLALSATDAGCKVYLKPNIGEMRVREYPA